MFQQTRVISWKRICLINQREIENNLFQNSVNKKPYIALNWIVIMRNYYLGSWKQIIRKTQIEIYEWIAYSKHWHILL